MASAPPLRVWFYGAGLLAGIVGSLAMMQGKPVPVPYNAIASHTRQFLDAPAHKADLRVLGLGSSILWAATPPAFQTKSAGVSWMRMTKPGPGPGYLQASLDMLEKSPPEVLVIEENLLLPEVEEVAMEQLRQNVLVRAKNMANYLVGHAWFMLPQAYLPLTDQRESFVCAELSPALRQQIVIKHALQLRTIFDSSNGNSELSKKLWQLSQRGVHIIVLQMRRSELTEQNIALQKLRWQQRLRTALPPGPQITYLLTPDFTRQDLFCDGSHMNEAGARLFSSWWQSQLQQLGERH